MTIQIDKAEVNEEFAYGGNEAVKKIKLITVHGTGAGDITATGDRWWQLGSSFLEELGKRLDLDPSRVEIVPFQWELGPNSEVERRVAGKRLYDELMAYDEAGTDYYVVSHSHGGSVVYGALLQSVDKGKALQRLKCWCTVGTPFLDYRPNRFLPQRLSGFGLTAYAAGMVAFVLSICIAIKLLFSESVKKLEPLAMGDMDSLMFALIGFGVICVGGLYLYERFHRHWFTRSEKKRTSALYAGSWLGLWHLEDEAISALANIKMVNAPVIPRTFLKPLVAAAQLSIVLVLGGYLVYDIMFQDAKALIALNADPDWGIVNTAKYFGSIVTLVIEIFIFIMIVTYLVKFFAWVFGRPLSWLLNKAIWSSVRERAWGDDLLKEGVYQISSHPPEFDDKYGPLPDPVALPLRGHSEKHAILTLHKVREVLGMTRNSTSTPDLRSELNESLKWQELIHTSYFDVPEFVDLLAVGLYRAGLAELREGVIHTVERDELLAWCGGVSATQA